MQVKHGLSELAASVCTCWAVLSVLLVDCLWRNRYPCIPTIFEGECPVYPRLTLNSVAEANFQLLIILPLPPWLG